MTRTPTITTAMQHCTKILACTVRQEKEIKCTRIGEATKISLCTNYKIGSTESPGETTATCGSW